MIRSGLSWVRNDQLLDIVVIMDIWFPEWSVPAMVTVIVLSKADTFLYKDFFV
jgi:hypothetical protein